MIRKLTYLSIMLAGVLFPMFASAQSIFSDSFDTYNTSGWTSAGGNLPVLQLIGCVSGNCIVSPGGNSRFDMQITGASTTAGTEMWYVKTDYNNPPSNNFFITVFAAPYNSGAPAHYVQQDIGIASSCWYNSGWHLFGFEWAPGTSTMQTRYLLDCSTGTTTWSTWSDSGFSNFVPDSLSFENNGFQSGGQDFIDELSGSSTPAFNDTSTHIISVTPAASSTIATSSAATFGVTGYVSPLDYVSGMTITMKYAAYSSSQAAVACVSCLFTTVTFDVSGSGAFNFSTTSPAEVAGLYTMQTNINAGVGINFFNLLNIPIPFISNTLAATSTTFLAGQYNGFDQYMITTTNAIQSYLASSTISLASCTSFTSFNLGDCVNLLFVPQPQPMQALYQNFQSQFLSYFPWGYVTRFIGILSSSGTSTLPSATVNISLPYMNGGANDTEALTINPTATLAAASAALNVNANGTSLNWQGVLEPYVQLFIGISLLFIVVHDLLGTAHHFSNNSSRKGTLS